MAPKHPPSSVAEELALLSAEQRDWLATDEALRARADELAVRLAIDAGDVYHLLKQLARTPTERLRRGLAHGRRRPRISH